MDKNIEFQLENQGRLIVPFVLVALYWGVLVSLSAGRVFLGVLCVIWAVSTIAVALARRSLAAPLNENVEMALELVQKASVVSFTAALLPLFLLMNIADRQKGSTLNAKESTELSL